MPTYWFSIDWLKNEINNYTTIVTNHFNQAKEKYLSEKNRLFGGDYSDGQMIRYREAYSEYKMARTMKEYLELYLPIMIDQITENNLQFKDKPWHDAMDKINEKYEEHLKRKMSLDDQTNYYIKNAGSVPTSHLDNVNENKEDISVYEFIKGLHEDLKGLFYKYYSGRKSYSIGDYIKCKGLTSSGRGYIIAIIDYTEATTLSAQESSMVVWQNGPFASFTSKISTPPQSTNYIVVAGDLGSDVGMYLTTEELLKSMN